MTEQGGIEITPIVDPKYRGQMHLSCGLCDWLTVELNKATALRRDVAMPSMT